MKRLFTMLFVSGALITGLCAQDPAPAPAPPAAKKGRVEARKKAQQERIAQGVQSGALTPAEAAKLENKEAKLNAEIRKDRKDGGGMTKRERAKIEHKQDRLSKDIAKQKHDRQHAK